jgi:hypothetical protein
VGEPERKRQLRRPRRRWEYNINMDGKEIGWVGIDWINLAQDRNQWRALVNTVMNLLSLSLSLSPSLMLPPLWTIGHP